MGEGDRTCHPHQPAIKRQAAVASHTTKGGQVVTYVYDQDMIARAKARDTANVNRQDEADRAAYRRKCEAYGCKGGQGRSGRMTALEGRVVFWCIIGFVVAAVVVAL